MHKHLKINYKLFIPEICCFRSNLAAFHTQGLRSNRGIGYQNYLNQKINLFQIKLGPTVRKLKIWVIGLFIFSEILIFNAIKNTQTVGAQIDAVSRGYS